MLCWKRRINGTNEKDRSVNVSLSFLDKNQNYKAIIYTDPENGGWLKNPEKLIIKETNVNYLDELDINLAPGGGQAIHFKTIK